MALNFSHRPSVDILDVLPSDPFGMDINNTFTAITGWLEDLEVDYNQYGSDDMFAGLSFIWNNAMRFHDFPETSVYYYKGPESLQGFGRAFDGDRSLSLENTRSGEVGESSDRCINGKGENSNVHPGFCGAFDGDETCHGGFISASSFDEVLSLEDCEVGGSSDRCINGRGENSNVNPAFGGAFDGDRSFHGAFSSVDEVLSLEDTRNCEVGGSSDRCINGKGENSNVHPAFCGAFDGDGTCHGAFISASSYDEVLSLEDTRNCEVGESSDRCINGRGENANVHPAFGFCLYHLGVKDLLSVSMACKTLNTIVRDDLLLWKHIHICQPLNEKITEEALLHLIERAQGTMQCLRLVDCSRITDDCLKRVLERNTQIVKLSVPGCTRITIDGLLSILRDLKSAGKLQVKQLEIGGLFGVTKDHYDELFDLLNIENNVEQTIQKPRFYHRGDSNVSCDDNRALDIEMCPKCQNSRLVYDCPAEDCKGKEECRACSLCIQRCYQCGRCINDSEYEETFCLEFLCSDCSKPTPKLTLLR